MPILDAAFPRGIELPECARELLKALYPTIRWEKVTFHAVVPAFLMKFTRYAVTLPDPLSLTHVRVFIEQGQWNGGVPDRDLLALLVHECYHVLQYQQRLKGFGLGPLRPFVVQYLAASVTQGGGEGNRFEKPAYAQERAFIHAYDVMAGDLCAVLGHDAVRSAIGAFVQKNPALVKQRAEP